MDTLQERLQEQIAHLLNASELEIPLITSQIQRLRVALFVTREIGEDGEDGASDPNTYREIALLQRMSVGKDLGNEEERLRSEETEAKAVSRLESRGINPESARRIARVLDGLVGSRAQSALAAPPVDPDDEADDEPEEDV